MQLDDKMKEIRDLSLKLSKAQEWLVAQAFRVHALEDLLEEAQVWICGEDCSPGRHRSMCLKLQASMGKPKCAPECCKRPAEVDLCCICECHEQDAEKPLYDPAKDETLKSIDAGIQAIKDMSTIEKRVDPPQKCGRCDLPLGSETHREECGPAAAHHGLTGE